MHRPITPADIRAELRRQEAIAVGLKFWVEAGLIVGVGLVIGLAVGLAVLS